MYEGNNARKADVIDMQYATGKWDKYLIFLSNGGATWSVIKTDVHNGKDSRDEGFLRQCMGALPYAHYERIYVWTPVSTARALRYEHPRVY
jgi:hypothetical protein